MGTILPFLGRNRSRKKHTTMINTRRDSHGNGRRSRPVCNNICRKCWACPSFERCVVFSSPPRVTEGGAGFPPSGQGGTTDQNVQHTVRRKLVPVRSRGSLFSGSLALFFSERGKLKMARMQASWQEGGACVLAQLWSEVISTLGSAYARVFSGPQSCLSCFHKWRRYLWRLLGVGASCPRSQPLC